MRLTIGTHTFLLVLLYFFVGCATDNEKYNYIKVVSIIKSDSINNYNKGFELAEYMYYSPQSDSLILRVSQVSDSFTFSFRTYIGKLGNSAYTDTLDKFKNYLGKYSLIQKKDSIHCYQPNCYCTPDYFLEYNDRNGSKFFALPNLESDEFIIHFLYRLDRSSWVRKEISDKEMDKTTEVVSILKGFGIYDSIIKRYSPMPCYDGIDMTLLQGAWRTIGDEDNDQTLKYTTNTIDKSGKWIINYVDHGKIENRYTGQIKSIGKDFSIEVESNNITTHLQIMNLTKNCLKYSVGKDEKQIWRLDRLK